LFENCLIEDFGFIIYGAKGCANIENCELIKTAEYPKSWEELEFNEGFKLNSYVPISDVLISDVSFVEKSDKYKVVFATESQCKSSLAFAQLTQLHAETIKLYNKNNNCDWKPDYDKMKYSVFRVRDELYVTNEIIIFPTPMTTGCHLMQNGTARFTSGVNCLAVECQEIQTTGACFLDSCEIFNDMTVDGNLFYSVTQNVGTNITNLQTQINNINTNLSGYVPLTSVSNINITTPQLQNNTYILPVSEQLTFITSQSYTTQTINYNNARTCVSATMMYETGNATDIFIFEFDAGSGDGLVCQVNRTAKSVTVSGMPNTLAKAGRRILVNLLFV